MIKATIVGSFKDLLAGQVDDLAARVSEAMADTGLGLRENLRAQVRGAGLGDRLARTWQMKLYPRGRVSLRPAAFVYSKAPKIISAFEEGTIVKSAQGGFLAIPTEAAPKTGIGGKRISPKNWPDNIYGRLRFVYRPGRPSLLVVDNLRARTGKFAGRFARASAGAVAKGRGLNTVVMFILVPQAKMPKLLNIDAAAKQAEVELIKRVGAAVGR